MTLYGETQLVSPARVERLLELACVYNVPLTITAETSDNIYRYKSRMFELKKTPDGDCLVIDHPVTDGPDTIALTPKVPITIFFALDKERFLFETRVLRKVTFTLEGHMKTPALEVLYPNVLRTGQRRMFYRVTPPMGKPISVECGVLDDQMDWLAQEPGTWNFPSHLRFEGRVVNISAGGLLLAIEGSSRINAQVGTRLGIRLLLAFDETPLTLKAIIRRVEGKDAAGKERLAMEFIDTSEKFEYKLAINRLYRYVADRQREIIKSGVKPETKGRG